MFFGGTKNPSFPSSIISGKAPTLVATIGNSAAIASKIIQGKPSLREGSKKTSKAFTNNLKDQIENSGIEYFEQIRKFADQEFTNALSWAGTINLQANLPQQYEQLIHHARNIMFHWASGWLRSQSFGALLSQEAMIANINETELSAYLNKPATPLLNQYEELKDIRLAAEKYGILDIGLDSAQQLVNKICKIEELDKKIKRHIEKYDWIEIVNFVGQPITYEKIVEQLKYIDTQKEHEKRKHAPTQKFNSYVVIAEHIAYIHQSGAETFSMFTRKVRPLLEVLARDMGITYLDFLHLTPLEVFENGILVKDVKAKISRRKNNNSCLLAKAENVIDVIDDKVLVQELVEFFLPKSEKKDTDVLRGSVGNKGKATGPVRVIITVEDFHKMKQGDVLVAPMTTPDFVLLMQKSSAIVTDMGGLLCHAAIVSRELNKPCVIGVGTATQILKDDDLVEVDADQGIVKIIKKNRATEV